MCFYYEYNEGDNMEKLMEVVDTVLKNRSLTIFLGVAVLALFFGWVGGSGSV